MTATDSTSTSKKTTNSSFFKHVILDYTPDELDALMEIYNQAIPVNKDKEIIEGVVTDIDGRNVILDLNAKSDGIVSITEFKDMPNLKIGDQVEVFVVEQEDIKGQFIVSRKKAKLLQAWEKLHEIKESGESIQGLVKRRIKGGVVMNILGLEVFLPGSQINVTQTTDFDSLVGCLLDVVVVKINKNKDNAVVSRKALIERELNKQRKEIIGKLQKGQVLLGVPKNATPFGIFLDLGGITGLLHKNDIACSKRIENLSEAKNEAGEPLFELEKEMEVAVKDFDLEKNHISLSTKLLYWAKLPEEIQPDNKIKVTVQDLTTNYALVEVIKGVTAILHASEISHSNRFKNPQKILKIGEEIEVKVLSIDREKEEFTVSIKQLQPNPWEEDISTQYAPYTKHTGQVYAITKMGVYLEIAPGIEGFLQNKQMSWTKRIQNPTELFKEGDAVEVMVIDIDTDAKLLQVSTRELEENPWSSFQETFTIGSQHQGNIIKIISNGAIVEVAHGVQCFIPNKDLGKKKPAEGEIIDLYVIDFIEEEQKIILSYNKVAQSTTSSAHTSMKNQKASATLGDLQVLQQLKKDLAAKNKEDKKSRAMKNTEKAMAEAAQAHSVIQATPKEATATTTKKETIPKKPPTSKKE